MSILQEYEEIKKIIGKEKWSSIDTYINTYKQDIILNQIIYNPHNFNEFNNWFYENIKLLKVEVSNVWDSDYGDVCCNATLYKNGEKLAKINTSYDDYSIKYNNGFSKEPVSEEEMKNNFKALIYEKFNFYINLPKISTCSKLLQNIYDNVCLSDASMCHISNDDWNKYYLQDYSEKDIDFLEDEIDKYGLHHLIGIGDEGYKIIGYGNLEIKFNDDRESEIRNESEIEL